MSPQRSSVKDILKQIRLRIRIRRVLLGVLITLAVATVCLLSASVLANKYGHKPALLVALRVLPILFTVATAGWFILRTLRQKISDRQIARLVEEKFSLDDRLTTVVELNEDSSEASQAIVNRLIHDTDERLAQANVNQVVDPRYSYAYGAGALAVLIAMIASLWWLAPVKGGISALYSPFDKTVSANAMFINVTPVTSRVPRGSDQKIKAALNGFDTSVAQVFIRKLSDANWLATPMEAAKNRAEFQYLLFNIQDSIVYYVEANGIRSTEQTLEVVDLPYVKQVDLVLNFPAFTGLVAKVIDNGGEVAALKGTVVRVKAILSGKAKAARIVLSDGTKIEMSPDFENTADNEFHFVGQFTVKQAGTYKIELTSEDGERYNGSNEYDITLLEDAPPSVVIDKPGRDMKVTNIQEIFTQAKAEDDFGVSSIAFFYTVNGGEEKSVQLQDLKRDEPKTLSGTHTFFLEEMNLQVGDFISYYAKAKDVTGQESTSDIYFLEVRPFEREFRQSQQQGAPGGGEGEPDSNALTKKQREIIAATFRVQREEKQYTPPEKEENFGAIALSQEKLKAEADSLIDRIRRRLGARLNTDQQFSKLVEYISNAATEMDAAKDKLREKNTKEALPPEQRALQQLLKAEALNREIQISQQQGQGSGGGQQDQKDLADLFELQLDKMKNQYETVQRQQQQSQSQQQDELARKLQELSQRQQKELEQRMRSQMQQQGGGQGGSQRQQQEMIEEAQRLARELERLSRDRRDPKMQQAAEQLRQAAEEMKRAQALSSSQSQAGQSEASAQTQRAMQRMEQARRMLNSSQQASGQQGVQQLRQRAEEAMRRQNDISKSVDELAKNGQGANAEKKQQLAERKQTLAEQVSGLEKDIDQAARSLGSDKQQAAEKLRDAANSIRRNRIPDRIKQNNQLIDGGYFAQAGEREKIIKDNLEEVLKNLQAAESGANRKQGEGMEEALNRARELADNLESMRRKMEQGGNSDQQGRQNQAGQQQGQQQGQQANGQQRGQQGSQQGRQGQQANGQQTGQQGQQGSQQGQQGSQQGQTGQQGRQNQSGQQGQQARGQQAGGQQQGGQQQGQQAGQQSRGQQGSQQGQQGQQAGGQQRGGQQQSGQQGQQSGQQAGQQQGGQQAGQQQGQGRQQGGQARGGQQQGQQAGQQSGDRQMQGGGGPPSTSGSDRQASSELGERLNEAQELRRALRGNNDLTRDLDKAIEQLRRINPNAFNDPSQMAILKSEVIDPLRQIEVELARRLQGKLGNGIGSLSDGDAPDRYRKLIEEYYKRLSSRTAGTKP